MGQYRTPEIGVDQLAAAHAVAAAVIVDVREPQEYVAGHVPGARLIPMGQVAGRMAELDRATPVHVICATGNRSLAVTDLLRHNGFDAWSVAGGTSAWARSGRPVEEGLAMRNPFTIIALETPSLGDRSYVVHDGEVAFVVDPQRDIDRVLTVLETAQVRLTHVFETHIHNDYITGGLGLARRTGATYLVNAADEVSFERTPVHDRQTIAVGEHMRVTALATPGHTYTHLSYALTHASSELDDSVAVFTGGSLLYGATGRPDLLGPEHTETLVRHQHSSAHRLAELLDDRTEVLPTHGFGSFCSATQAEATESTIGQEKTVNPVLTQDERAYARALLDGLGAWPAYYAHMAPRNAAGPTEPDLSTPSVAEPDELRRRIENAEWVVDLGNRTAFAAGHVRGTLNFGLDGSFATYLGWMIEWGTPVTLLGETAAEVAEAQRELVRIGIDRPAAHNTGGPQDWTREEPARFPVGTFEDLAQVRHHREVVVLDVRREEEYAAAHISGAVNIPIHELTRRLHEVPPGEIWVHCEAGYRASVAASVLDAAGLHVVAIDDEFVRAGQTRLELVGFAA